MNPSLAALLQTLPHPLPGFERTVTVTMTPEDEAELRDTRSFDDAWMDENLAWRKKLEDRNAELEAEVEQLKASYAHLSEAHQRLGYARDALTASNAELETRLALLEGLLRECQAITSNLLFVASEAPGGLMIAPNYDDLTKIKALLSRIDGALADKGGT